MWAAYGCIKCTRQVYILVFGSGCYKYDGKYYLCFAKVVGVIKAGYLPEIYSPHALHPRKFCITHHK
jgi:hypothetical protein